MHLNSDDKTRIGGPDDTINPGTFGVTNAGSNLYVAPGSGGRYQLLANNCLNGSAVSSSAAQLADNDLLPTSVCRVDSTNRYGIVAPEIERFGASARFTANLNDTTQAYLALNFQQSTSSYTGSPSTIYANAPTGVFYPQYSTRTNAANYAPGSQPLTLPVYVCAARVNCATAADGRLNPNNPFAATGDTALLVGGMPNSVTSDLTRNRVYRAALGVTGQVFGWDYTFDATAMHSDLKHQQNGYVYIQHLLDVIADGSYNFVNPSANSAATLNYLMPQNITNASSDLYQGQISFKKAVMDLPGGPLNVGFGGSLFYEAIDSPSANSDFNGPTERYFTINAFGTEGHRTVASAFGEINAPVLPILDLNLSGRYDHYSTGQSYFSPKVGAKLTPIRQLTVRGTWSRGFRIPSFAEANALPTSGYVNNSVSNFNNAYLAQYGCTVETYSSCPTYLRSGSYGNTTLATPDLKPEKSRSWTAGIYFEPIHNVSFTVDYFNIKKTGAITTLPAGPAISAYYSGQTIPAGYEVIADAPDPAFPNAKPRIAFIRSSFVNANTVKSEGIDFGMNVRKQFGEVNWTSNLDATLQLELSTTLPDGTRQTYVDTLGNYNLTAGSGTFQWHGNWQNTFAYKQFTVSGTVNYTSGYDLSAMDQGNAYSDCGLKPDWFGGCRVKSYITFDLNAAVNVNDRITVYGTVLNLFDRLPGVDPATYGAYLYNPVQAGNGVYGRMFRAGAKFTF